MGARTRELGELISVGPAMLRDFEMLGIRSVEQLAKQEPMRMYRRLEQMTESSQDPCVLDVFCAAVAQARDPRLPVEQSRWRYWSKKRKETAGKKRNERRSAPRSGESVDT